jgi:SAM-dependent methyltransferase
VSAPNREQAERWNNRDEVGQWIDSKLEHDQMLDPFIETLIEGAQLGSGDRVLDVGCGSGATTIATARVVAPGTVVGIDLSGPMLDLGRADAEKAGVHNISFQQADAQTYAFGDDPFDSVISRFGIMFFDDPVAAFRNLHAAARPGGRLAFVCWQLAGANEWLRVPSAAFTEHVPPQEVGGAPGTPGMFAFADPDRATSVLQEAGWHDVRTDDTHTPIYVGGHGTVEHAVDFLRAGSIGRTLLSGADPDTQARAIEAVRAAFEPHHDGRGVRLDAAVWLVSARA